MKTFRSLALALVATLTFTVSVKHPTAPTERPSIVLVSDAQAVTSGMMNGHGSQLLNHIFRNTAYTLLPNTYMGLGTGSAPTTNVAAATAIGTSEVNPNGTGYQRVAMPAGSTIWGAPSAVSDAEQIVNSAGAITFPAPTGNWCTGATYCTWFFIADVQCTSATVCGNLTTTALLWGTLTAQKNVNSGDAAPSFATSAVTIKLALLFPLDLELGLMAANEPMVIAPADIHLGDALLATGS